MPDRPLTVKQAAFSKWLYTPGSETFGNQIESARKAEYKGNYGTLQSMGAANVLKPVVIAERARIEAETQEELDLSRERQHVKLQKAYDIAETAKNSAAMTTAVREQNEMLGYHRDKAPNPEAIAGILQRMDSEELLYRQEFTIKRTRQVSEGSDNEV